MTATPSRQFAFVQRSRAIIIDCISQNMNSLKTLQCERLGKVFPGSTGPVTALADVNFSLEAEEFISIVGPSGCGKTTLLKMIAGLGPLTSGSIVFNGSAGQECAEAVLVFQDHGLFPWMTVLENVAFGLECKGVNSKERKARAMGFINKLGLGSFASMYPSTLSMGMRQRVGIARAFVSDPQLLLLDEPFGSLDAQTKIVLQEELLRLWRERSMPVILVTHDIEEAVVLSDRVLVMSGRPGTILEDIPVPLGRPRGERARENREVLQIKHHIWDLLRDEVRTSLNLDGP